MSIQFIYIYIYIYIYILTCSKCLYCYYIYIIRKQTKAKSALSNCVAGITGETAIADMWRDHYEELLNSSTNSHEKEDLLEHIGSHVGMQVTMLEVLQIVKDLPNAKSSGLDGLNGESLNYAHPLLCLLLSIGFTCMFKHCYIPLCMINSVIIPLIRNICGDQNDNNNYRPIALSSIISKVFEHIIAERLEIIYMDKQQSIWF